MHAKGIQPEDSYDFFDAHHPRRRQIGIDISPMQNLMDPTGEAWDDDDHDIDDWSGMNDLVAM